MSWKTTIKNPRTQLHGCLNDKNITLRSSWEMEFVQILVKLKRQGQIVGWGCEMTVFEYFNPVKNRMARYFMDFTIFTNSDQVIFVEVKPNAQTKPPRKGKNQRAYFKRLATYKVNEAKWKAVEKWCKAQNEKEGRQKFIFTIRTEKNSGFGSLTKAKKKRKK